MPPGVNKFEALVEAFVQQAADILEEIHGRADRSHYEDIVRHYLLAVYAMRVMQGRTIQEKAMEIADDPEIEEMVRATLQEDRN